MVRRQPYTLNTGVRFSSGPFKQKDGRMKVVLYIAATMNGYIARSNDDSDFLSGKAWEDYKSSAKRSGNIVMGRRTYDIMCGNSYSDFPFNKCLSVVLTRKKTKADSKRNTIFTDKNPHAILRLLGERGYKSVFLAGGTMTNGIFMKAGLIDEIYIYTIPLAISSGFTLFPPSKRELKLKLMGSKELNTGIVRMHYKVVK